MVIARNQVKQGCMDLMRNELPVMAGNRTCVD